MTQQTFIAFIIDTNNNRMDFERFNCAKVETVKRQMQELFKNALYRACTKGAAAVAIYRTPDGYHEEEKPACIFNI